MCIGWNNNYFRYLLKIFLHNGNTIVTKEKVKSVLKDKSAQKDKLVQQDASQVQPLKKVRRV